MDYGLLPPEVNSGLMYAGPGSGPLLAAASAWEEVATELESAAGGYSSELTGLTGLSWFGPSSMAMSSAAAPYAAWLQAASAQAGQTAVQAYGAAAAYEAAYLMTVPPPVIAANRAQLMALISTNFLGQNTPAIAATEAQYAEMWVQDAAAMYGYAADASAASTLTPYDEPPQTTNLAGQDAQARAMAQTTAQATGSQTQSVIQQQLTTTAASQQATSSGEQLVTINGTTYIDPQLPSVINSTNSVTIANGMDYTVPAGGTIIQSGGSITVQSGGMLTVDNALTIESGGSITVNSGGILTNGSILNVGTNVGNALLTVQPGGTFINTASLFVNAGSTLSDFGTFTNTGVVSELGSMTVGSGGAVTNAGSINVGFSGTLTVAHGGTVTVPQGGSLLAAGGQIIDSGTLTLDNGATLNFSGPITVTDGGTLTLNFGTSQTVFGSLTVNDGAYLTIDSSSALNFNGAGTLTIGPNEIITISPGGSVQPHVLIGQVAISAPPVPPVPPVPTVPAVPGLSTLSAPGLAGTSGIQPQFNFDALQDSLSGLLSNGPILIAD